MTLRATKIIPPEHLRDFLNVKIQGRASAGIPITSDSQEEPIELYDYLVKHPEFTSAIWVDGESMIEEQIDPGDLLIVDNYIQPEANDVIVAMVDDKMTVKKFARLGRRLVLIPANKKYTPLELEDEQQCDSCGVVTFVIKPRR